MLKFTFVNLLVAFSILLGHGQASAQQQFTLLYDVESPTNTEKKLTKENIAKRYVKLDETVLDFLAQEAPSKVVLQLPLLTNQETVLELESHDILTPNFQVIESSNPDQLYDYEPGVYYHGKVRGVSNSLVAISVFRNEVMGTITVGDKVFSFGKTHSKEKTAGDIYTLISETALLEQTGGTEGLCGTSKQVPNRLQQAISKIRTAGSTVGDPQVAAALADQLVRIYFECDYRMYQDNGSSTTTTANFVTAMFNVVNTLYANEQINTQVSEVFVWTTPDAYPSNSSSSILNAFGNKMNTTAFNGNLAQLLSTKPNGLGGIAWLDVLCETPFPYQGTYVGPFSYSNINNSFAAFPTYSWTCMVVTHELGHNIGSPHTQSCSWPGGAIDNCYATEGGCAPGPAPVNGGTIMSYCHLTANGINFSNGFGLLPGNLIRDRVTAATCLGGGGVSCTLNVSPTSLNYAAASGTQNVSITSSAAWTATDNATWLTLSLGAGAGNATITATAQNNTGSTRTATITVTCGSTTRTVSVSQAAGAGACVLTVNPTSLNYSTAGGSQTVAVSSNGSWSSSDNATWISISRGSGSGNGTPRISVDANTGAARTGTVTFTCGGTVQTVAVSQAGTGGGCTLTVSPSSLNYTATGGNQSFAITSSGAWTASDNATWLTLSSASGSGNANVTATAQTNTGAARSATITVTCGATTQTISVTQDGASSGCTLTVTPSSLSYSTTGGGQNISITSSAAWNASDDAAWLSLSSTSGSGNATITATAQANTGGARSATVTITCGSTTRTVSITQSGVSVGCTLSASPTSLNFGSGASNLNVNVVATDAWTASDNASWITLSPAAGSGNGSITVSAASNTRSSRSATITITCGTTTQTIAVTQAGRSGLVSGELAAVTDDYTLAVSPIPARNQVNIDWQQPEDADVMLQLFDLHGRLVWQKRYNTLETGIYNEQLEIAGYAPGAYILRLNTPKAPIVKRIIIE